MEKAISAAGATRRFSELLRSVKQVRSFIITSQGRRVVRLTPVSQIGLRIAPARAALFARLRTERAVDAGHGTRDDFYDAAC